MIWKFTKTPEGIEAHDGNRVRALIVHRRRKQWVVHRVRITREGEMEVNGGDTFPSLSEAKNFCSNKPGVWGV